jgi:hypothetical protein
MITVAWFTLKQAETTLELGNLSKIAVSSVLMAIILMLIPTTYAYTAFYMNNPLASILALIYILIITFAGMFIYISILTLIGGLKKSDVNAFLKLAQRTGPLAPLLNRLGNFLMRYVA